MNKKIVIAVTIILLLIGGGIAYLLFNNSDETNTRQESTAKEEAPQQTTQPTNNEQISNPGSYVEYSEDLLASTQGTKILFFHAPWCPQCRDLEKSIKSATLPEGLTIFKVDYDSNQELRQKYDVTIQTTLVKVDDSGKKIKSYVAYEDPSFDAVRQNLLP